MEKRYAVYVDDDWYTKEGRLVARMETEADAQQINLKTHDGRIVDLQTNEVVCKRAHKYQDDGRELFGWSGNNAFHVDYKTGPSGRLLGLRLVGDAWVLDNGDPLF